MISEQQIPKKRNAHTIASSTAKTIITGTTNKIDKPLFKLTNRQGENIRISKLTQSKMKRGT